MNPPNAFELVPAPTGVPVPPVSGYATSGIDPLLVQLVMFVPLNVNVFVSAASNQMLNAGTLRGSNPQMLLDVANIVFSEQNIVGR